MKTNITPDTVVIGGTVYVPADTRPDHSDSEVRIVIAQRGWVWVGRYSEDGDRVVLADALNIRKWGTSRGLGELVGGPLTDTVLDPAGSVELHRLGVVASIRCEAAAWGGVL